MAKKITLKSKEEIDLTEREKAIYNEGLEHGRNEFNWNDWLFGFFIGIFIGLIVIVFFNPH
jgi:hypothetical protein